MSTFTRKVAVQSVARGRCRLPELRLAAPEDLRPVARDKVDGRLHDLFENRRDIGRGLADDPQDAGTGCLPRQSLLHVVEPACVFDGDAGLASKGLQHLQVGGTWPLHLWPADEDDPPNPIVIEDRNANHLAHAKELRGGVIVVGIQPCMRYLHPLTGGRDVLDYGSVPCAVVAIARRGVRFARAG